MSEAAGSIETGDPDTEVFLRWKERLDKPESGCIVVYKWRAVIRVVKDDECLECPHRNDESVFYAQLTRRP